MSVSAPHITTTYLSNWSVMEAAGLAVGVVGLLALYDEAATTLYSIKHFSSESLRVASRYNATKVLFERWGKEFRVAEKSGVHPGLNDQATVTAVADLLKSVRDVFAKADSTMSRYHGQNPFLANDADSVKAHFRSRVKWAVADGKRLSSQVQDFDDLVQKLYSLVPPGDLQNNQFQKLQDALVQSQRTEALSQATHWLDAMTTENSYDAYCSARLDTTCGWIDTHPVYRAWCSERTAKSSKILWINGPPGFGKSVLCAYIITSLLSRNNHPVYYFFCSGDSESQRNPSSILRAWIYQAMHQDEAMLDIVLQYLSSCRNTKATLSDLWQLLKKLMSHCPNAVFAVDGLDECPRSTNRVDLHRSREDILSELVKVSAEAEARVLVVSRNEGDIRSQLSPHGPQPSGIKIYELSITRDLVSSDVTRFAQHVVNHKLPGKTGRFNQGLAARMAEKGDGMFLFIRLQSQNLRPRKGNSQLQRAVDEMPTDLLQIYRRNWIDIQKHDRSDRERAEAILRWVTFSCRPLTIAELSEIVAVLEDDENNGPKFDDLPDPFDNEYVDSEILGLCGSFLELRASGTNTEWGSQTVHLIHHSAEEFFLGDHSDSPFPDHPFQHYRLLKSCLTYLDHEYTWQPDEREDRGIIYQRPFLTYVVRQWYNHLGKSNVHLDQLQPRLQSFFGVFNPNWDNWRQLNEAYHDTSSEILRSKDGRSAEESTQSQNLPGTRMYYAALFGLERVVRYLYSTGVAYANEAGGYFGNPVQAAAGNGHLDVLKFLLEIGADIHWHGRYGSALHAAAAYNQDQAVIELLQHGSSISATDDAGRTSLLTAVYNESQSVTQILVAEGADLSVRDNNGQTCLHLVARSGNVTMAKLLLQNKAIVSSTDKYGYTPLYLSAGYGNVDIAIALLDSGADLTSPDTNGFTPLHNASSWGQFEIAKLFIGLGADTGALTNRKSTPLHFAARNSNYNIVKLFLESGADVSALDENSDSPLNLAAWQGHYDVVRFLIDSGADVSTQDRNGDTPLNLASHQGHTEVVKLLINTGSCVLTRNILGDSSLHLASWRGHLDVVEVLIRAGAAVDTQNENGQTPLHYAFQKRFKDIILALIDNKAPLDCLDFCGMAPWQYSSAEFRARIPQCENCKAPTENSRRQMARASIQMIVKTISPMTAKSLVSLRCLGNCLQLQQDFASASIVWDQTIWQKSDNGGYKFAAACDSCGRNIIGQLYSCCVCPGFDLCASCMKQYSEGNRFHDCTGHEYLRVPSEDWNPQDMSDVYTQEFVDWLKDLALRYQMEGL
ncbi:hypothetical protein ASPVEDRAFT_204785 [Aspergillus versicolor CBS 583.65]|uniref:NACHT domain-containing protein n=1 Tax=Aspergillus versicolor CBS 583.65 TaxID=1036611 RepID=A0A1L9Q5D7_ASPVE|nr:uncharacterized protein ASPVEDRAFT_204785 [Aspergillus versicolor CBS 583.65]OJJ08898.1 hypothetical protein ASPVEDRAFT_204785 [Aspergillus versicolor CBS 583.65]